MQTEYFHVQVGDIARCMYTTVYTYPNLAYVYVDRAASSASVWANVQN